jgi:ketosteroid isomerase-like protein
MRRMYELLSAGDIDGFGDLVAEDFVEHDEVPGLEPTKEGVKQLFRSYTAAFPDLRMEPQGYRLLPRLLHSVTRGFAFRPLRRLAKS